MAFSNLIKNIEEGTGKYDPQKKYFINNATNEDIVVTWALKEPDANGSGTYHIKAGEKGGPYAQFLAYHIVKALVSREMQKDGKAKFFGTAEMRAPYENKYLIEITGTGEDAVLTAIREQERAKILAEMKAELSTGIQSSDVKVAKPRGRPKKVVEFEGANL